jgi:thiol-disulfide isomerase/thioredoxin
MPSKPSAPFIAAIILVAFLAVAGGVRVSGASADDPPPAPPFSGTTLDGRKLTFEALSEGRPYVVLVFFGVNCKPCQKEIALLNDCWRNEAFRDRARFYAINADGFDGRRLSAELERRKIKVDFPVIPDDNQVITNQYVDGIVPLTVVIGKKDRILLSVIGARIEKIRKIEELILAGKESGKP